MDTIHTIGRRKASVARIYMSAGKGNITINKKDSKDYFSTDSLLYKINQPLKVVNLEEKFDIKVSVFGGGTTGQADAIKLAIARALYNDPSILIFDESTSALDAKTENNLLDSIYNLKNKKTLIIISHKESILYRCETIYKIENKKIVKIK